MFYLPLVGLVGCAAFATYLVRALRTPSAEGGARGSAGGAEGATPLRTALDVSTAHGALGLVRRMSAPGLSTDAIADRLTACYRRFPPHERNMQRLHLEQARLEGSGGALEFATSTVYASMVASCVEADPP